MKLAEHKLTDDEINNLYIEATRIGGVNKLISVNEAHARLVADAATKKAQLSLLQQIVDDLKESECLADKGMVDERTAENKGIVEYHYWRGARNACKTMREYYEAIIEGSK